MAATPFQESDPPRPSGFFSRLLRRPQPEHAEHKLTKLLATRSPTDLTPGEVSEILAAAHLRGPQAHSLLVALWSRALESFLADDALSDAEHAYLLALRKLMDLAEDDIIQVERSLIHPRFDKAIAEVLADRTVTAAEREALAKLGSALRISPAHQQDAFKQAATQLLQEVLNEAVTDRRLSSSEEDQLKALAANLGVEVRYNDATQRQLSRFSLLWRIEHGELPTVPVPLALQKGELCHFVTPARWSEYRKTTQTVGYRSLGVSFRIARGVYYRIGASRPQRVTTEGLTEIDSGTLYITSKRLFFDGGTRNTSLRLQSLVSFQVYSDGLAIEKSTGRTPYLLFDGDVELAATILGRLLAGV